MPHLREFVVRSSLLLVATLLVSSSVFATEDAPGETVRILRDPWGVPHVIATTDYGAAYGYGQALAQDRLEEALSAYFTALGRRTEIDGVDALRFDRTQRLLRLAEDVEKDWPSVEGFPRDIACGFAAGMNDWMEAHPDRVPEWGEKIEPWWPLALARLIPFLAQLQVANGEVAGLAPPLSILIIDEAGTHFGSNGWAVSPKKTEKGKAFLGMDPHLPWHHEFLFHETHLRGATFEVAGGALMGLPLPVVGRGQRVAWSWTWNWTDHADVYRLTLDPEDPERYLFDGKSVPFESEKAVVRLAGGERREELLRYSVHGPVTWHDPEKGLAVAYRMTAFGLTGAFEQFCDLVRADSVTEIDRAMEKLRIVHFNLVAADSTGSIELAWGGRIPRRPEGIDARKPLDGTTSSTLWDAEDVVPWKDLPRMRDPATGFVQNCNNVPDKTTGTDEDPRASSFPKGVVLPNLVDDSRAWYLRKRLREMEKMTEEQALALLTDGTVIPFPALRSLLAIAWRDHGKSFPQSEAVRGNVELLLSWDGKPVASSPAPTIFNLWMANYVGIFVADPLLDARIDGLGEAEAHRALSALLRAQDQLASMVPLPRIPWGLVHVIRKHGQAFPVETGMYPGISLMNATIDLSTTNPFAITCRLGSSYVALHVMEDPVRSVSILPLGQTERIDLPYALAMTPLFARRELKPLPFTDGELANVETVETVLRVPQRSLAGGGSVSESK
jgi:acyl-homoserine-lactone acylase